MFHHALRNTIPIKMTDQKFFESWHSQNEGESIHSAIESNKRNLPVYVPFESYNVIRTVRRKIPYVVILIYHEIFLDLKTILNITS